jgi:hypothetical protein
MTMLLDNVAATSQVVCTCESLALGMCYEYKDEVD